MDYNRNRYYGPFQYPEMRLGNKNMIDDYTTPLTMREFAQFLFDKQSSPWKRDSGYDYDLQGYWLDKGKQFPLIDQHLPDDYKKPWHPTFSEWSKYYNGQPNVIDWTNPLWDNMTKRGFI